ncbi:MAG: PHP domain-containing protein [Candidatus Omnitrophota bacterium]|nr:PHP domain-containing protein [Candidatus Omnitrophota bacterium]
MQANLSKKCDLHIHSIFSDSDATIEDIFKKAKEKKLSAIAIADHDTIEGLPQAKHASNIYNIELIEAIELSAQKDNIEVHVLGYLIDSGNTRLQQELAGIRESRKERLVSMIGKLSSLGLKVDSDELIFSIKGAIPTRLHLGLYLVKKGFVKSLRQAFDKYLSPGKPGYIARFKYSVKEAIKLIKSYGGLAFLAHPHLLGEQSWIEEFVSCGLDGLEVIYPNFSPARIYSYETIADKFGLLKSGGSDAHGSYKEFTEIGAVPVPYEWVEEMKSRIAHRA